MTNSSLVSYKRLSPNCTIPRNKPITKITVHHMAGNLSVEKCGEIFAPTSRKASSNYGIGSDGRIGLYVEEKDRSWCSGNAENDNMAVTIEVANCNGAPNWEVSDEAFKSLVALCIDICIRNNIEYLYYTGDKLGNLTLHQFFQATACPGPYLKSKIPELVRLVNDGLDESRNKVIDIKGEATIEPKTTENYPILRKGCTGDYVKKLQTRLVQLGYDPKGIDGIFGPGCLQAVKDFQRSRFLVVDGIVGPKTWRELYGN